MQTYIKRIITTKIKQKLENMPGVVILGPRQCGKSTLAKAIISEIRTSVYLDLERPSDVSKLRDPEAFFSLNSVSRATMTSWAILFTGLPGRDGSSKIFFLFCQTGRPPSTVLPPVLKSI